jgi:hypothetical protein
LILSEPNVRLDDRPELTLTARISYPPLVDHFGFDLDRVLR